MATIDSLDIQISAQVNKANASIEALSKKLDRLSVSLSGVNSRGLATLGAGANKLANAMSNFSANTKTADFSRLSRNLKTIGDIDTSKFSDIASKMSQLSTAFNGFSAMPDGAQQIGEFARNISRLGGKNVQNAITNIPQLATAMRNLMQTLSTAPRVSQNTIQMTRALANLAAQGSRAGTASRAMVNGLNNTSNAMNTARKSSLNLAVAFGKLYATYFALTRGFRKLWGSIESSFNYLEVLNYFDAAFGQVAQNADLSAFEEMGYDSADAYYNSFAQRAEELTAKMSGFTVGEGGLLESTGAVSLGLDPSQLMNYQAMFGQMSSSMGVASETALKLSQALTEIGADLASVKNMEFEDVWNDMASGLAGMSRTLDKYGVNIRNVNLQQKLTELGINANIAALNQNDKALLRTIILLDSTRYAWGDLADTINQPANQLRLIQANFQNLARTIGNLFLPIVKTVLPYINALVIAVQRLFAWLGNLIGIDISGISTSMGKTDISGFLDQTDDLSNSLGGVAENAKKAKAGLRAFDELNVINTPEADTGAGNLGGIGGAGLLDEAFNKSFEEYQKAWDEAFGELENRAQELADNIEKAFEPVKKIIQDFAVGDFFQAGKDTSALVASIFEFFTKAIKKVKWKKIGEKIGDFFTGIKWGEVLKSAGSLMWEALKAAFETYVSAFNAAPIEIAFLTSIKILKFSGVASLILNKIFSKMTSLTEKAMINSGFSTSLKSGIQKAVGIALTAFGEFSVVYDSFKKLAEGAGNIIIEIGKIGGAAVIASKVLYNALGPAGLAVSGISFLIGAIGGVSEAFDKTTEQFVNSVVFDNFGISISKISDNISNLISTTGTSSDTMRKFADDTTEIQGNIDRASESIDGYRITLEKTGTLSEEEIGGMKASIQDLATALKSELECNTDIAFTTFMTMSKDTAEQLGIDVEVMTGILSQFQNRFSGIYDDMQSEADALMDKMLAGTATEADISSLYKLLDDLEYLSGDAIKRQVELQNSMAEMLKIDFSSVEETTTAIQSIKETGLEKLSELDSYYEDLTGQVSVWQEEVRRALELGRITEEEANSYYDWLGALSTTYNANWASEKAEIENQIGATYDYIKSQLELKGTEVYEEAEKKNEGFWEAIFAPHKDTRAVNKFTEDIYNPIIQSINEAKKEINPQAKNVGTELWENFRNGVEEADLATNGIYDIAVEDINGYKRGIEENADIALATMKSLFGDVIDTSKQEMKINSPSKVFGEIGLNTVLGFNDGIEKNKRSTLQHISSYARDVINEFSKITNPMQQFGTNAMLGLYNGLTSMENSLYEKASKIAYNIASTIKFALQIHSPSKVMFEIGDYTMQGFQNGLESLYKPILSSAEIFSHDLQVASAPSISDMYGNYQYQTVYIPQNGIAEHSQNSYNQNNAETNALLRRQNELLERILAKPNLSNGDVFNAVRTVYKGEAIRRYGNSAAFDPVLG